MRCSYLNGTNTISIAKRFENLINIQKRVLQCFLVFHKNFNLFLNDQEEICFITFLYIL